MKILDDESGQTTILVAIFTAILLLGLAALAVDVGMLYREKRMVQNAADAAALAASAQYGTTDINTSAATAAHQQPGIIASGTNVATITSTLVNAANSDVQVVVTQPTPTVFMRAFNSAFGLIRISAVAEAAKPPVAACINALSSTPVAVGGYPVYYCANSSGSVASGGIVAGNSGGAQISSTGCAICSNSSIVGCTNGTGISSDQSINSGGGKTGVIVGYVTAPSETSKGGCTDPYSSLALPAYSSGCKAVPWAGNSNNGITGQVLDANPFGPPYCDFTTGKLANLTLSGGTYLFSKSFTLTSAPVTATAPVTLIMLPGTNLNGGSSGTPGFGNNASIQITAPSSGDYAGIAIWDDSGTASNPDTMTFNGGSSTVINGAIYAPHTIIEDGGNSGVATVNGSITAWAIQVGGSGGLSVKNSSSGNNSGGQVTLVK